VSSAGHFGGIEAKKQWSHVLKFLFPIKSNIYKDICIKTQETPETNSFLRINPWAIAAFPSTLNGETQTKLNDGGSIFGNYSLYAPSGLVR
jgi:hypothetical protein